MLLFTERVNGFGGANNETAPPHSSAAAVGWKNEEQHEESTVVGEADANLKEHAVNLTDNGWGLGATTSLAPTREGGVQAREPD